MKSPNVRILHLEDDSSDRELVKSRLEYGGLECQITYAASATEYTAAVETAEYDIILADYKLPGYNGLAALDLAHVKCSTVPFIFVSGTIGEEIAVESLKRGATDYILKDRLVRLVPAIERALNEAEELRKRLKAEEAIVTARDFYLTLFETFPALIWRSGTDTKFNYFNKTWLEFTGKPLGEELGEGWMNGVFPEDSERYRNAYLSSFEKRISFQMEYRLRHFSGEYRWMMDFGTPYHDLEGNFAGYIGSCYDIHERKQAENERVRLMIAIEQASEILVITDENAVIQYVNPVFETITGYKREEVIGKKPSILKSGKHNNQFYEELWQTILSGKMWHGRFMNKRKDGTYYVEDATISPVRGDNGKIVSFIALKRDVTHEVELESQLRQSQKMEAIGRLAGGVAHDFNNLLTVIAGHTDFLKRKLDLHDPLQEDVGILEQMVGRGAALTRQLLAFSRHQQQMPEVFNLNYALRDMEKMLKRLVNENIQLIPRPKRGLPNIKADQGNIEQVIMNLIVNAKDAMPNGGQIILETDLVTLDDTFCSAIPDLTPGDYCTLSIMDTGTGMSPDVLEHAVEPFFTTKPLGQGTGLGLSTVHGIIKQSGGHFTIESEINRGTVVRIYLPVVHEKSFAGDAKRREENMRGTETVLLVEDEVFIRDMICQVLQHHGYSVIQAANPAEALAMDESTMRSIQLLITDVIMPGINGKELSERLVTRYPDLKVLFMSGYTTESIVHEIEDKGIPFLRKPFGTANLLSTIRSILDKLKE